MSVPPYGSNVYLSELSAGINAFANNYSLSPMGPNPGFSKSFMVKWDDLRSLVVALTAAPYSIAIGDIALKFIYRFDPNGLVWFVTLAFCKMDPPLSPNGPRMLHEIPNQRYDLINGIIVPSSFTADFDPVYFNSLYYFNGTAFVPMDPFYQAKWSVFPWQAEIQRLYDDNFAIIPPVAPLNLVFESCSFYCNLSSPNPFAAVEWPHCIALYFNEGGVDRVDNNTPPASQMFLNKAADYASLCPPTANCPFYILPPDLHW
jgi:hypothetical protein